jgi:cytochrome c-type biogenesis protein CcmH/NrfG
MEALASEPNNVKLLLILGTLRIQSGHPEDAIDILTHAQKIAPKNPDILEALGAAHYQLSLIYKMQPRPEAQKLSREHLAKALAITPKNTDLYKQIKSK